MHDIHSWNICRPHRDAQDKLASQDLCHTHIAMLERVVIVILIIFIIVTPYAARCHACWVSALQRLLLVVEIHSHTCSQH